MDTMFSSSKQIDDTAMQILARANAGEIHNWDIFEVLRHPLTGQFYVATGSGCSCSGLYDDIRTLADLAGPMSVAQVRRMCQIWENNRTATRRGLSIQITEKLEQAQRPTRSAMALPRPARTRV